ncbi:DUF4332 domain-containing protein [Candidatus Sumerlaeota bacterium]|nr:DUF4332 domain-containing protein [Candidatus Sumerlaeota bacterium]
MGTRMRVCHFLWFLGLAGVPASHWLLLAKIEPFYTPIYAFLWWSFIFATDFVVYLVRGRSMLHDRPREFLLLSLWSTPVWLLFEAINLRLMNWYYVQVPAQFGVQAFFLAFSFATVLPGVFEVAELVVGAIERLTPNRRIEGRPFRVTRWHIGVQIAVGAAMLVLTLAWPERFFCLAWGFAFLIFDPICYARRGRSLLGQLASGDNTRLVALLVSGFVCGGLWEAWNIGARTKWIYTVPFFDQIKLGEMPALGFLGFPPFVLECYAIVNFINLFRGGRSWELDSGENRARAGMKPFHAIVAWLVVGCLVLPTAVGMLTRTVSSISLPLDKYFAPGIGPRAARAIRESGARHTHEFLALEAPPEGISPQDYRALKEISALAEFKGMGVDYAMVLWERGIVSVERIAAQDPEQLTTMIRRRTGWTDSPTEERVKVWIVEARRQVRRGQTDF